MPSVNEGLNYTVGLDIVSVIAVCAFAVVVLILAILAVAALFKQKSLLTQINNTLTHQCAPAAPSYAPAAPAYVPIPNTCPKCGAMHAPGAGFCQNCGASLQ